RDERGTVWWRATPTGVSPHPPAALWVCSPGSRSTRRNRVRSTRYCPSSAVDVPRQCWPHHRHRSTPRMPESPPARRVGGDRASCPPSRYGNRAVTCHGATDQRAVRCVSRHHDQGTPMVNVACCAPPSRHTHRRGWHTPATPTRGWSVFWSRWVDVLTTSTR